MGSLAQIVTYTAISYSRNGWIITMSRLAQAARPVSSVSLVATI